MAFKKEFSTEYKGSQEVIAVFKIKEHDRYRRRFAKVTTNSTVLDHELQSLKTKETACFLNDFKPFGTVLPCLPLNLRFPQILLTRK